MSVGETVFTTDDRVQVKKKMKKNVLTIFFPR